jgi:hypothetical protein
LLSSLDGDEIAARRGGLRVHGGGRKWVESEVVIVVVVAPSHLICGSTTVER